MGQHGRGSLVTGLCHCICFLVLGILFHEAVFSLFLFFFFGSFSALRIIYLSMASHGFGILERQRWIWEVGNGGLLHLPFFFFLFWMIDRRAVSDAC